jgi:hypothetical protein
MRSHPSPARGLPRAVARALVLPALLVTAALPSSAQVPQLGTRDNRLEGTTFDIAGPADAAIDADQKRVWIAQGRVRTAIRISDRQRQFGEDISFSSSVSDQTYESIIALEHAANQRLYTLTTDALYREDVSNPSAPTSLQFYDFSENTGKPVWEVFSPWDSPLDLKVWPIEDSAAVAVLVLTTKRIITLIDHGPGNGITFAGYTPDMYDPFILIDPGAKFLPTDHCGAEEIPLNVVTLRNLRVQQDQNGQVMAYVTADMAGYNNLDAGRPFPKLVIACYLDSQNGFVSPRFDLDPAPSRIHYRYFNPVPTPPPSPPPGDRNADWTINSLDAFSLGNERYLYLACGKKNQVKRLKVTNAYPATNCSNWAAPDETFDIHLDHHVNNVLADRDIVTRFFALTQEDAHILDTSGVNPHVQTQLEPFGVGCRRDMLQIAMPSPTTKTLWTAVDGIADHIAKVVDVTSHPPIVPLIDEYYAMLVSDGAVMLGTDVYLPTWGGMVRFHLVSTSPPRWQAVPDSFQPAEETTNKGIVYQTEHIDTGNVGGTDHLFAPTGTGDLLVFPIDAGKDPLPPELVTVDTGVSGWPNPSWFPYPAVNFYSNDGAYFSLGGQSFVLVDLTNYAVQGMPQPTTQTALLAYRYNAAFGIWEHRAMVVAPPHSRQYSDPKLSSSVTIAPGLNNKWFAFVAGELGFMCVDLTKLTDPTPTMTMTQEVCTNFQGGICEEGAEVSGLTVSMDRIFAYLNATPNPPANPPVIRIYSWNRDTGMDITQTAELSQSQFLPPGAPGAGRCFRARFHTTNTPSAAAGFAYFANEPYLLQMKWPGATGADSLDFTGWWRSDYEAHLQDCRFYDVPNVGPSILVSKDGESFAVIKETP